MDPHDIDPIRRIFCRIGKHLPQMHRWINVKIYIKRGVVKFIFRKTEQLFDDFQDQVKSCCDLIEQKEKEQQNTQEIKTEQVQEKSEEIEKTQELSEDYREYGRDGGWYDKEGYYRYENGTYFDPQGRFFDEFGGWYEADGCTYHKPNLETDKEDQVLTNEETKKSYLVIDDEMTK